MKQTIKQSLIVIALAASGSAFSNTVTSYSVAPELDNLPQVAPELKNQKPPAAHIKVRNVSDRVSQKIDRQLAHQIDIAINDMLEIPEYSAVTTLEINL